MSKSAAKYTPKNKKKVAPKIEATYQDNTSISKNRNKVKKK